MNSNTEKPSEIPVPNRTPEIEPKREPEPKTWPDKRPEILPGKDPDPSKAPVEVPSPREICLATPGDVWDLTDVSSLSMNIQ